MTPDLELRWREVGESGCPWRLLGNDWDGGEGGAVDYCTCVCECVCVCLCLWPTRSSQVTKCKSQLGQRFTLRSLIRPWQGLLTHFHLSSSQLSISSSPLSLVAPITLSFSLSLSLFLHFTHDTNYDTVYYYGIQLYNEKFDVHACLQYEY